MTDVHFPTDMNLLWDAGRKCVGRIEKYRAELGHTILIATDQNQLIQDYRVMLQEAEMDQSIRVAPKAFWATAGLMDLKPVGIRGWSAGDFGVRRQSGSGDGAFGRARMIEPATRLVRAKAVSRCACHRSPRRASPGGATSL